jgi:hypothetical protein
MKYSFFLLLLLNTALANYSVCENVFLFKYNKQNLSKFSDSSRSKILKFNENLVNSNDLNYQMKSLNMQFNKLVFNFSASRTKILNTAEKYKSNQTIYYTFIEKKLEGLLSHYKGHSDILTDTLATILRDQKIPFSLKTKRMSPNFPDYKYIELDLAQSSDKKSLRILAKYQEMFEVKHFTIDLLDNIRQGFAGFRNEANSQIDLGILGIKDILIDDILTLLSKHEVKHSSFGIMRQKNIPSPFHTQFKSGGTHPISKVESGYDEYLSAEELFNYVNNPYWAARRLKNIDDFNMEHVLGDLNLIHSQVKASQKIAEQVQDLTETFLKYIEFLQSKLIPDNKSTLIFFDHIQNQAVKIDDAVFMGIVDEEKDVLIKVFITKSMKGDVKKYLDVQDQLMIKFNKKIQKTGSPKGSDEAAKFIQEFLVKEAEETKGIQLKLMKEASSQVEELLSMAIKVQEKAPEILRKQTGFINKLNQSLSQNTNFQGKEKWQKAFREQVRLVRDYANVVRLKK